MMAQRLTAGSCNGDTLRPDQVRNTRAYTEPMRFAQGVLMIARSIRASLVYEIT